MILVFCCVSPTISHGVCNLGGIDPETIAATTACQHSSPTYALDLASD